MLYRPVIAAVFLLLVLGLWTPVSKSARGSHAGLFEFLTRSVQLCEDDLRSLKAGQTVAMEVPTSPRNELFLFGAVRLDGPLHSYLAEHRNPFFFENAMVQAWGQLDDPPSLEDLKDLTWPEEDLKALPECRPGSCKVKLPPGYLDQVQPLIRDGAISADQANALMQQTLLDYLNSYRRHGNEALMNYSDSRKAVSIAEEFEGILANFSPLNHYTLDLQNYLKDYPDNRPPNTKSRFIWAKVLLGGKAKRPIIFLYHLVTHRMPGGNTAVALKQIYASHYYEAALGLTLMLPDPEDGSRSYLLHFDRGRIDVLRHIPGFLSNGFREDTCTVLARRLEEISEETNGESRIFKSSRKER